MEWSVFKLLLAYVRYRLLIPLILITFTAITICYVVQCNRKAYNELQQVFAARNNADVEWGQLLLQYGTLTSYSRIEHVAKEKLHMVVPNQNKIILIKPDHE